MTIAKIIFVAASLAFSGFAMAGMPMHEMHEEMNKSMEQMHHEMSSMKPSNDAEVDFMRMMIPHHKGAIDMARIYLKYGKNPEIRARAEKIISDQNKEIEELERLIEAESKSSDR